MYIYIYIYVYIYLESGVADATEVGAAQVDDEDGG
jgi:hypothetical protein